MKSFITFFLCLTAAMGWGLPIQSHHAAVARLRVAGGGGGGPIDWIAGITGGFSTGGSGGERGMSLTVGASNVTVTHLAAWITAGTYADTVVKIRSDASTVLGSVTVPISGATVGAYRWVELSPHLTLTASGTYYLMREQGSYNEFPQGGSTTYTSTHLTAGVAVDQTTAATGDGAAIGANTFGTNLRYNTP